MSIFPVYTSSQNSSHFSSQNTNIIFFYCIAPQIARRCAAFDMNILYHKRSRLADNPDNLRLTYATLDELLRRSDFVVIIVPLTEETTGLIGRAQLAKMKNSAVLVNVSRGPVVDTEALTEALQGGIQKGWKFDYKCY